MWNEDSDCNVTTGSDTNATTSSNSSPLLVGKSTWQPNSLFPVAIKQIKENKEDPMTISGFPVSMMTVVGIVMEIQVQPTKIIYSIQDWSGSILGVMWLEGKDDLPKVTENMYCRITGTRRIQHGEPSMVIYNITPIENMCEITHHFLQVIYVPLKAKGMSHNPLTETDSATSTDPTQSISTDRTVPDDGQSLTPLTETESVAANDLTQPISTENDDLAVPNDGLRLTPQQRLVYDVLKNSSNVIGLTQKDIFEALPDRISLPEIDEALDFLTSDGYVYATIDYDHFKAVD